MDIALLDACHFTLRQRRSQTGPLLDVAADALLLLVNNSILHKAFCETFLTGNEPTQHFHFSFFIFHCQIRKLFPAVRMSYLHRDKGHEISVHGRTAAVVAHEKGFLNKLTD